jgi:hypothetical protein
MLQLGQREFIFSTSFIAALSITFILEGLYIALISVSIKALPKLEIK